MKISVNKMLAVAMLVFCFSTLTYSFWPPINRILAILIIAALGFNFIKRINGKEIMMLLGMACVFVSGLLVTEDMVQNIEDWLYWAVTCMLLLLMSRKDFAARLAKEVFSLKKFMLWIIVLSNIALLAAFFIPESYTRTNVGTYFRGFAYSQHSVCCGSCLLLVLILLYYKGRHASITQILLMLPASVAILDSGARTFLLSLVVIWLVFYRDFVKSQSTRILLFPAALIVLVYAFLNSGMMDKFINTSANVYISEDTMTAMSSGRLDFWKLDLEAYQDLGFFPKLLGMGFDYVYKINQEGYGMRIWAHNDIINLLLSAGLVGLALYLGVFASLFKKIIRTRYNVFGKILLILYITFPMLFNGVFIYQHYLYSFVLLFLYCTHREDAGTNVAEAVPHRQIDERRTV